MFANFRPKRWLSSEISDPKTWHAHPGAGPHSLWTIKLTNSATKTNKYICKVFPRAWSVIGFKGYFIQQDFHTPGAPEARLQLIEIQQTSEFL